MNNQPFDRLRAGPLGKSKFLIAFLTGFIIGVFLGDLIHLNFWWLVGISFGLFIALIIFWRETYWRLGIFILIGLTIGLGYFSFWDQRQKSIKLPYNKELAIEGQIVGHPDYLTDQSRYTIIYDYHKIQLTAGRWPEYHYGDVLRFTGELKKPNDYSFHQGILGQVFYPEKIEKVGYAGNIFYKAIYFARDKFEEILNKIFTEPYASFAAGLVLGSKRNIPDSLMSDFNRTGTTHIVAVSGYNLTILIVYIAIFFGIFSRKLKFWGTLLIIIAFVIMTGASASVVRAGILASLVALGRFEGRRINMTILILLVAAIMLLFNPYVLKFDISFQLSFLAFAGLIYLSPLMSDLKIVGWLPKNFKSSFSETVAAQIMVFPVLIFYFDQLSIVSPLVNILILWLVPTAMGLVYFAGFLGLIYLQLGQLVGYLSWLVLRYIIVVVESFSKISWAAWQLKTESWWWMVVFYAILLMFIFQTKKIKQKNVQKIQ